EFLAAVRNAIGADNADRYQSSILRNALVVELANEPPSPAQEMALVEAGMQPEGGLGDDAFDIIYFDFDRSNIKPEFRDAISKNAQVLMDNPDVTVVIEGHADERGTTEYNLALGQRRANSVRQALIEQGVDDSRLDIVSYGEERPVDPGHNEEAWAKNRRGVLTIEQQ
ncbi:MAG TPA: peptidoglycan-associated lipoprotein Pal, partial [Gammaproteobacteria bacterium]|nr:peptidoglycan-associated lipoprotein Pal [Gammaproteobacteria bacterium]